MRRAEASGIRFLLVLPIYLAVVMLLKAMKSLGGISPFTQVSKDLAAAMQGERVPLSGSK